MSVSPAVNLPPLQPIPPILSPDAAARFADCGRATIYSAIKAGRLESFKQGNRRRIYGQAFQKWLAEGMPQ